MQSDVSQGRASAAGVAVLLLPQAYHLNFRKYVSYPTLSLPHTYIGCTPYSFIFDSKMIFPNHERRMKVERSTNSVTITLSYHNIS